MHQDREPSNNPVYLAGLAIATIPLAIITGALQLGYSIKRRVRNEQISDRERLNRLANHAGMGSQPPSESDEVESE